MLPTVLCVEVCGVKPKAAEYLMLMYSIARSAAIVSVCRLCGHLFYIVFCFIFSKVSLPLITLLCAGFHFHLAKIITQVIFS